MTPPQGRALRILMTADAVGGVWIYASTLARDLCEKGFEVVVVTLGPEPRSDQLDAVTGISGLTLEITDLALEWIDPEGLDSERAADRLALIERRVQPDVVHLNSYREAMYEWRAPVVVVAHSCVRSWWHACRGGEPTEPRWLGYMTNVHAGLAAADRWVAPTGAFRDTISRLYQPGTHGLAIWNGIEARPSRARKQPFILAAGRRWDEAKNLSILGDIAPGVPWPIHTIGATRVGSDDASSAAALPHGEGSRQLSHAALLETMQRASILASPAVYEPFGLSVLEAAAAGCALVLSDIDSFRELWDGAALFVDAREGAEWQAALASLTRNDALREELQRRAARRARRYSLRETVRAYIELYENISSGGRTMKRKPHPNSAEARL
jgi:glycosyltransferase involved in cell wall biosynthesis